MARGGNRPGAGRPVGAVNLIFEDYAREDRRIQL